MPLFTRAASLAPDRIEDVNAEIKVVYPKPDQTVTAVDSAFVLGNVPGESKNLAYKLFINDQFVPVHEGGGFIAFLPVTPGDFEFRLEAVLVDRKQYEDLTVQSRRADILSVHTHRSLTKTIMIRIPKPLAPIPYDSITTFDREINPPAGPLALRAGDKLKVELRGSPGRIVWFSIDGVADSVPMAASSPRVQPYWGESVFGAGAVPESLKIEGIYTGFYDVGVDDRCDSTRIKYHLAPITLMDLVAHYWPPPYDSADPHRWYQILTGDTVVIDTTSSYPVTLNDPAYPFAVRFTDSVLIVRHGPLKGYFSIFQPSGVLAMVVAAEGDWYKIKLSRSQYGWVNKNSVEILPKGVFPPQSYLASVRSYSSADNLILEFPLSGMHPFKVVEDNRRTLRLQLFGVTSNTDWIRYDFADPLIDLATWQQAEEDLYEFKVALTEDLWGFDTYYKGNTFYLQINKPPEKLNEFKGKRIVIDPGHSSDAGAIGPTGLREADANLHIALELGSILMSKGADVIMTRIDSSHVELYDRPAIAKLNDADLFVSIHNNALPDGVDPFENNGSSTYYYHPHSIELARAIHRQLVKETGLRDYGLYHGNLAVNRPTQYPAVLVEGAFMILPEQEAMLKTDKFRKKIAKAIAKGIEEFLDGYDEDR